MELMMSKHTSTLVIVSTIWFFCLGFSPLASSQSDSCSSQLSAAVSTLIPFNSSALTCNSAWPSEGFILRYGKAGKNVWSFVLSAPDSGTYVSVGFSKNGRMDGSSAMAGWQSSSTVAVKQYYLGGKSRSACPPDQGSLQLVPNTSVIVADSSRLYLAFQLNSAQPDRYLIYAVGPQNSLPGSDNYLSTHRNQASASVNYATGVVSSASGGGFAAKQWHGLMAMAGWGILMPVGVAMARYFKHRDPFWFYSHISIQGVGFVLGLVGILIGFSLGNGLGNAGTHKAIGVFILIGGCLQVLAFLIRPDKAAKIRRYWNWYHHYVGRAAIILAMVNVFVGLSIAHESASWTAFYVIYVIIWAVLCIFLEVKKFMKREDQ